MTMSGPFAHTTLRPADFASRTHFPWLCLGVLAALAAQPQSALADLKRAAADFHKDIQPILSQFCYDCHGDGAKKGDVAFDQFKSDDAVVGDRTLWWTAMKNLRAGIMPPEKKPRPSQEQRLRIESWIKTAVFGIDPKDPDPGKVTVRRLNRVEYKNTIRELMGVDFNTEFEFPPDDTGVGFDNIGDVLSLATMILQKYTTATQSIV